MKKSVSLGFFEYWEEIESSFCTLQIDNNRVDPQSVSDVYRVYTLKDGSDWKETKK